MNITPYVEAMLRKTGWTKTMLAKEAGISKDSMRRIFTQKDSDNVVDKLIPFIFGVKRPLDLPDPVIKGVNQKKTEE